MQAGHAPGQEADAGGGLVGARPRPHLYTCTSYFASLQLSVQTYNLFAKCVAVQPYDSTTVKLYSSIILQLYNYTT